MKPSLEIFTTRRSAWLTRRGDSLQTDGMPVFPSVEDDTETETTAPSRRSSKVTEAQWVEGDHDANDEGGEEDDNDPYLSDFEDSLELEGMGIQRTSGIEVPLCQVEGDTPELFVESQRDGAMKGPITRTFSVAGQPYQRDAGGETLSIASRSSSNSSRGLGPYQQSEADCHFGGGTVVTTPSSSVR